MTRTTRDGFVAAAILLAVVAAWAASARAQEPRPFSYEWYKKDVYWRNYYCGGEYRPEGCTRYRRWRREAWRHVYVPQRDPGAVCHPLIATTGDQAQSKENAEALALRSWQGRVRFHYGERYLDLANAKDVRVACSPSSVADTVGGKIQDKLLNISHFRCELSARPCRAEARRLNEDDD